MKWLLKIFPHNVELFANISTGILISFFAILYTTTVVAENGNTPFSISGNLKITSISDGDTLRSGKLRIRLFGIDAPEKRQQCTTADGQQWDCGVEAREALKQLVESVPQLTCNLMEVDRYSRLVMRCYAGQTDVAAALVRAGLALAYRQYSALYSNDENAAKITKAGMWGGSFIKPWTWRRTR